MQSGGLAVISPRAHRCFDLLAFPGLLAASALMARRDPTAAAVTLVMAAAEGAALLTTDYPPAFLPWMSFREHNRIAAAQGALVATLAAVVPGISTRNRRALYALASVPIVLATLSDTREPRAPDRSAGTPRRGT